MSNAMSEFMLGSIIGMNDNVFFIILNTILNLVLPLGVVGP
jgi:hypothetical protein